MYLILVGFIVCALYIRYGIYYAKGLAEYARFNNVPPNEEERDVRSVPERDRSPTSGWTPGVSEEEHDVRSVPERDRSPTSGWTPGVSEEDCWSSVTNESRELWDAILHCNPVDIILEASDVIHALIKYAIINYLPQFLFCHMICWLPVFLFVLPCTIKLGSRYREHGCIRNHQNKGNRNHLCNYNGIYKN